MSQPTNFIRYSKKQQKLRKLHGTPAEFARGCYAAVPSMISMDEAAAAVAKYNAEWNAAQDKPKSR